MEERSSCAPQSSNLKGFAGTRNPAPPFAMLDQLLGVFQSSQSEETMAKGFGDKVSGGRVVAALASVDIFEDCLALLWFYAALEDSSHAASDKLCVYYRVGSCPALHLPGRDLISRQLSIHQKVENGLRP